MSRSSIARQAHLALHSLVLGKLMPQNGRSLFEDESPVRSDPDHISVIQEETRGHLGPTAYQLVVHICAIDGLAVSHIDMIRR